jgi:hypothetical protein
MSNWAAASNQEELTMQHTHHNAHIGQILQVAVIDSMSEPGIKALKISKEEIRLQKTRHIDVNIARMLKLPVKIPYTEVTRVDENDRSILMETHIAIKSYKLSVATLYQEKEDGKVNVECRLVCEGVQPNGIIHMGLKAYVTEQFRAGRHAEEVALLSH